MTFAPFLVGGQLALKSKDLTTWKLWIQKGRSLFGKTKRWKMNNLWKIKSCGLDSLNSCSSKCWPWNSWSNFVAHNQVWFLLITPELIRRCLTTLNLHLIRNIWKECICISFKSYYVMGTFEVMKADIYYKNNNISHWNQQSSQTHSCRFLNQY